MFLSEYSCKICCGEVKDTDPTVLCDLCEKWIHTDCASIGETQHENLKESPLPWYCLSLMHHGTSLLYSQKQRPSNTSQ